MTEKKWPKELLELKIWFSFSNSSWYFEHRARNRNSKFSSLM